MTYSVLDAPVHGQVCTVVESQRGRQAELKLGQRLACTVIALFADQFGNLIIATSRVFPKFIIEELPAEKQGLGLYPARA